MDTSFYLNTRTGVTFYGTFEQARAKWSDFFVRCNDLGNSCIYNGDRRGHSKGFCTADACY